MKIKGCPQGKMCWDYGDCENCSWGKIIQKNRKLKKEKKELLSKASAIKQLEWRVEQLSAELASETNEHQKFVCEVAEKIESAKKLGAEETTRKIMVELNRTRNIVRENYGISEQVGVDIAITRVDVFYKELMEGKVKL